jgi:hypothetical protein
VSCVGIVPCSNKPSSTQETTTQGVYQHSTTQQCAVPTASCWSNTSPVNKTQSELSVCRHRRELHWYGTRKEDKPIFLISLVSNVRGGGNPVTGPGGPIGWMEVQLNSFLTLALEGGVWSASCPGRLYPRERPGTHCTGGWVGPGAGLDKCEKSRLTGIRSPDLPARSESLYLT